MIIYPILLASYYKNAYANMQKKPNKVGDMLAILLMVFSAVLNNNILRYILRLNTVAMFTFGCNSLFNV